MNNTKQRWNDERSMAFEDMKVTYSLSQENNGENVSVKYPMKKSRHVPSNQDNHGENISFKWPVENRIRVPSKPGQPWQEYQC